MSSQTQLPGAAGVCSTENHKFLARPACVQRKTMSLWRGERIFTVKKKHRFLARLTYFQRNNTSSWRGRRICTNKQSSWRGRCVRQRNKQKVLARPVDVTKQTQEFFFNANV